MSKAEGGAAGGILKRRGVDGVRKLWMVTSLSYAYFSNISSGADTSTTRQSRDIGFRVVM